MHKLGSQTTFQKKYDQFEKEDANWFFSWVTESRWVQSARVQHYHIWEIRPEY